MAAASYDNIDIVIAGSGAAGLSAAIFARSRGLRPLVIEKTDLIGGTSCYSGGVAWVPGSKQNLASGHADSRAEMIRYLDETVPNPHEREARLTYLRRGPEAVAQLEEQTGPLFFVRPVNSPDYYPELPGAKVEGRAITPISFDGRKLGKHFRDLRGPLPELCLFGRQMLELVDVYHLLNARRSVKSAIHTAKLVMRDLRDRIFYRRYGRGTWLTGGNALVANLYRTALQQDIPILRRTRLVELMRVDGAVTGVVVERNGRQEVIASKRGVVLATGGFPWSQTLRDQLTKDAPIGFSAASPDSTGDGITIALASGAQMDRGNFEDAFWSPVSVATRRDGTTARFPHLMADRAKPGFIAVNRLGKRFCNEAENYHDFVRSMLGHGQGEDQQPVHVLCDASFVSKYVFGAIPPLASERRRALASGYLIEAPTIAALAGRIGVSPEALAATIERHNADAERGVDTEFGKGSSAYNRYLGDATHQPSPCLAPIAKAPFYAIRVHAGDIGTAAGLAADIHSRVLDHDGKAIPGLYACGNDRNSIMGGFYPSGGITIGPAIVFSYLAIEHAARLGTNQ